MNACRAVFTAALIAAAVGPGIAHAACTQQDAMGKATKLSQLVQAKMASDPSQGQALMAKMQPIMQSYQGSMGAGGTIDWDKICDEYDALITQAQ
jgi:hypothetical protein